MKAKDALDLALLTTLTTWVESANENAFFLVDERCILGILAKWLS